MLHVFTASDPKSLILSLTIIRENNVMVSVFDALGEFGIGPFRDITADVTVGDEQHGSWYNSSSSQFIHNRIFFETWTLHEIFIQRKRQDFHREITRFFIFSRVHAPL